MEKRTPQDDLTLTEHLTELRTRIIYSIIGVTITTVGAWFFRDFFMEFIKQPLIPLLPNGKLVVTSLMDGFLLRLKVSFLMGVIFACPIWLYQVWRFVAPGLYKHERKFGFYFMVFGTFLFLFGVWFVYYIVYPRAFEFLMMFNNGAEEPLITLKEYLSLIFVTTLAFGTAFQLPLVLTLLGMMGIISKELLKKGRRFAIVIICILSAVLTPPDPMSMLFLVIPLYSFYELSILLVGWFGYKPEEF